MPLSIMFLASNYPPRVGGPATTVSQIARELAKSNHVCVVAFREKSVKNFERSLFTLYRSPSFYAFSLSNPFSVLVRTVLMSFYSRIVAFHENPQILHAHDAHISALSALFIRASSLKRRKVVVKYAGDLVLESSGLGENRALSIEDIMRSPTAMQRFLFMLQKLIFSRADYVHVQNAYQKNLVENFYGVASRKVLVLPNPTDLSRFKCAPKPLGKSIKLLTVSRLVPWKGLETTLRAFKLVLAKRPSTHLTIIGSGSQEYELTLHALAKELKISGNVSFLGAVENEKLPAHYSACNAFVQASFYEPFGITAIEALASGRPVIASDIGGLKELVSNGKTGALFSKGNAKALAEKILLVSRLNLSPSVIRKKSGVQRFSLENISAKLNSFYAKAITD